MDSKEFKERLENRAHDIGQYSAYEDFVIPEEEGGGTVIDLVFEKAKSYINRKAPALSFIGLLLVISVRQSVEYKVILPMFFVLILSFVLVFNIAFIRFNSALIYIAINIIVAVGFTAIFAGGYYTYREYGSSNFFPVIIGCETLESGKENYVIVDKNTYIVSPVLTTEQIIHRINQDFHTGIYHYDDKAYENKVLLYDYYNNLIGSYDRKETKSGYICVHFETWK